MRLDLTTERESSILYVAHDIGLPRFVFLCHIFAFLKHWPLKCWIKVLVYKYADGNISKDTPSRSTIKRRAHQFTVQQKALGSIAHQRQNLFGRLNISEQGEQMEVLQPRPAPPLPLNLQRISSSAPQSVLPPEPNLFATFLFQASFYLFLLAGSCESCQMELTG